MQLSTLFFLQFNGHISAAVDDLGELTDHQVQLSYKFIRLRQLLKFDCFDQSFLEAARQVVRCVKLKHTVTDRDQVLYIAIG